MCQPAGGERGQPGASATPRASLASRRPRRCSAAAARATSGSSAAGSGWEVFSSSLFSPLGEAPTARTDGAPAVGMLPPGAAKAASIAAGSRNGTLETSTRVVQRPVSGLCVRRVCT
ncbi:hypothetical protein [Actinacidiphila sp. bgisy160]|uniref:hypothetical protein n=1 Tax=Actinacidiphila sp. bgisy160 TaxID=3413796 RepID=UPI003D718F99